MPNYRKNKDKTVKIVLWTGERKRVVGDAAGGISLD